MRILADENVDAEWLQALVEDGHDVVRVTDLLDEGAPDEEVLERATATDRVLVTADQSDFADPSVDGHSGIVVVTDLTLAGGEIRQVFGSIESPDDVVIVR